MLNPESIPSNIEHAFVQNDEAVIAQFYQNNFKKVQVYVLKNSGSEQDAKDVYQDAFLVLWRKITDGKGNVDSDSKAAGFLYQVAKFKWLDQLGSSRVKHKTELSEHKIIAEEIEIDLGYEQRLDEMKSALLKLGKQCRELLIMFYYGRKNMEDIGNKLGMNPASARNQKYRCMKQLKELVKEEMSHNLKINV